MSSVTPAASISSQPPVAYTPPVSKSTAPDTKSAEKNADKVAQLTATAVAAQSAKEAGKGLVVDIQV